MPYIVIDTETSGKYIYKYPEDHPTLAGMPYPADAPDQPRVCEVAILWCDDDFNVEREYQAYIKPDGWEIDPEGEAYKKHGLRTEFLIEHGIPMVEALTVYHTAILQGRAVVAFNSQFDCKAMRGESRHYGIDDLFDETPNSCAMRSATRLNPKVVKLPDEDGTIKGGMPKLRDVVAHFGITDYRKHSALDDARVTAIIAKKLKEAGVLLAPEVHRAKKHPNNKETAT